MCPCPLAYIVLTCSCVAYTWPCALHAEYLRKCHMLHHVHARMPCAFMLLHWTSYGLCCHAMRAHMLHCANCARCGLHIMQCVPMCYVVFVTSLMAIYIVPLPCPCVILCIPVCYCTLALSHAWSRCSIKCLINGYDKYTSSRTSSIYWSA